MLLHNVETYDFTPLRIENVQSASPSSVITIPKRGVLNEQSCNTINCECFVCLQDFSLDNNLTPIRLIHQPLYIKSCICDGWIHYSCLENWYNANQSCPICRIRVKQPKKNVTSEEVIKLCLRFVGCLGSLIAIIVTLFYYY
jgi:hypothetical protein